MQHEIVPFILLKRKENTFGNMFLKKLYRYNKLLFGGFIFFAVVQLFCFYKGGMVFSPWYNFGMYSEVVKVQKNFLKNSSVSFHKIAWFIDFSFLVMHTNWWKEGLWLPRKKLRRKQ